MTQMRCDKAETCTDGCSSRRAHSQDIDCCLPCVDDFGTRSICIPVPAQQPAEVVWCNDLPGLPGGECGYYPARMAEECYSCKGQVKREGKE